MTDILMPALTDQMQDGTVVAWLVEDGATVAAGQELVEIETDKATIAHVAEAPGVLEIVAQVGDTVAVGDVIARVGDSLELATGPKPAPEAEAAGAAPSDPEPVAVASGNGAARGSGLARATPLARRFATEHGVDLQVVGGSGPRGRVTKGDVLRAAGLEMPRVSQPRPAATQPPGTPAAMPAPRVRIRQPTRLQHVVARRMAEATATVPHFHVQTVVAFDAALELRAQLKLAAGEDTPTPSVNDLIVKACALALPEHPLVNGSFKDDAYELHEEVHIGIAVAADDALVVATIRDANTKSLGQIAREARRLAETVRAGLATPRELTGATFSISNLGMYGMTAITPIINPPQAAILGVGATRSTLARADTGEIVDRELLTLTLSCDHRILAGADGSRFLDDVKQILERPLKLAL